MIDDTARQQFREMVWKYYRAHGRHDLPWRRPGRSGRFDPYAVMVSEVMLQQTQVGRVAPKYQAFLQRFPSLEALAAAPLGSVLQVWSGLGYNRRAKFLWQASRQIVREHQGRFPDTLDELTKLPGIGPNTAGAIMAYAFDRPVAFVETNIRSVFIHHFFHDQTGVADSAILALVKRTLPKRVSHYREWYWALTDYGVHLKQTAGNPNHRSRSYSRQSKFEGSRRQLRGRVIRLLTARPHSEQELRLLITDDRLAGVLHELLAESLVIKRGRRFSL